MPLSPDFLEILACPETKVPVRMLTAAELARLNEAIRAGKLRYKDGSAVEEPLTEGLITQDGKTAYRVDDEIPVMLPEKGIPMAQLEG